MFGFKLKSVANMKKTTKKKKFVGFYQIKDNVKEKYNARIEIIEEEDECDKV
jgi:hypothetical protein